MNIHKKISAAFCVRCPVAFEEFAEEMFCGIPCLCIDAVAYMGAVDIAADEPGLFQFLQVLRHRALGQGELSDDIAADAGLFPYQQAEDGYPGGMGQCPGEFRHAVVLY